MDPSAATSDPKPERIVNKVPGKLPPIPQEKDVVMGDLSRKSTFDLKELLERQIKILTNKSLVRNLTDKGKKATELKERIEKELKSRDVVDKAANLLSSMSLGQLNSLEWTGHCNPGHRNTNSSCRENPEYEETNPLKILASHSGTSAQKKMISILTEEAFIKPEDHVSIPNNSRCLGVSEESVQLGHPQREVTRSPDNTELLPQVGHQSSQGLGESTPLLSNGSFRLSPNTHLLDEPEPFSLFICDRFGHKETKDRFKPNKPIKPFTGIFPMKPPGRVSSKPKCWEETNVTPPPRIHGDAKMLSLEESLEIQRKQNRKLKEVQMKHAAEKLASMHGFHMVEKIPAAVLGSMAYRGPGEANSDSEEEFQEAELEDQELYDEDQQDHGGTVVYKIES